MPNNAENNNSFSLMPERFLEVVIHNIECEPKFSSFDAGYELGEWRYKDFAEYLIEWLLEFALNYKDFVSTNSATYRKMIRVAACNVYSTDKHENRGEIGEILLHALIRQEFNSRPAISKVYYKTSSNDTVKGFDAVHIVETNNGLELWLGEVKYYKNIHEAIRDVTDELKQHFERDFLKKEFLFISGKIDDNWEHASTVKELISHRKSLDDVFKCICIPVLLTYESSVIAEHTQKSDAYTQALKKELEHIYDKFAQRSLPPLKIHLLLVPLKCKSILTDTFDEKLKGIQV